MSVKLTITRRFTLVYLVLLMVAAAVVVQMVKLVTLSDTGKHDEVINIRVDTIRANRGNILAHDGRLLVTSAHRYALAVDLRAVGLTDTIIAAGKNRRHSDPFSHSNVDLLARGLNHILGEKSQQDYARELKADRRRALNDTSKQTFRYRLLSRREVDYNTWKELKALPILRNTPNEGGLMLIEQTRRIHPMEGMARNTVGRVNHMGHGTSGIEAYYNRELAGKPGLELQVRTTTWIPVSSTPQVEPVDGCDIVSTIDVDLQEMTEGVIREHLLGNPDLEWGTAVIMEVKTGEVRAIANKKKANDRRTIVEEENYALRYRKDPGSTFKLASFIIMLEKGLKLTDSVDTENGRMMLYKKPFEDEGSKGGWMSVQQVFEKSSNVGTVKLATDFYKTKEHQKDFAERIEALRLKEIVHFDLLHNQRGVPPLIKAVGEFSGITLAQMSIGYELEMTPLQTLTLYNAVANGGAMVHPRFIKEIRRHDKVVKRFAPQTIHASICSQKTLGKLHQMLLAVVERGTASKARSSAFKIAGKTGTALVAEGREGYTNQKLASFAGYFPAEAPRYSCIVMFKTYNTANTAYGGTIAAPAFKSIAEKVYARSIDWHEPIATALPAAAAPESKSGRYSELQRALSRLHVPVVSGAAPSEWVSVRPQGAQVAVSNSSVAKGCVPDVRNMGVKDAVYLLENAGLRVQFSGRGAVKKQQPPPGSACSRGDVVALTLNINLNDETL